MHHSETLRVRRRDPFAGRVAILPNAHITAERVITTWQHFVCVARRGA
jgi:hypothetical protein